MTESYFVCATPRTGSSLLLGLLASTGLAGTPESYFRQPDEQLWADRWKIPGPADPAFEYRAFVRAAVGAGTTPNGVFGAKLMWGTLDRLVAQLAPSTEGHDLAVLEAAFGPVRFVYLRREDELAQAVSWLRAEQTRTWKAGDPGGTAAEPHYDKAGITSLLDTVADHNAAWRAWFTRYGVAPHEITYEQLTADLIGTTRGVLSYLGLDPDAGRPIQPRHRRQGDQLNEQWAARYRAEIAR
ncbi:Stf0 family sulfotransferase [Actinoplanes auranticolor]|uniref:Trehalose 2-sulfotransferase n=1 Tax=Actinoplanes auranticolor TaxID=47988 RepID=A0A919SDP5_9ACTN|nr:Stf0 family sulfotransferase [Actinoplanes auranticolor]GIM69145.1 trehalose 2-sulfotransferase [Actinoplanes auranticolor]